MMMYNMILGIHLPLAKSGFVGYEFVTLPLV
jgi:hypothetical protein